MTNTESGHEIPAGAWVWPDLVQFQLLLLCGVIVSFGGYLISQAYRMGEAPAGAPFEYASQPVALLISYIFWGDWPDWVSITGSGLIIDGGLVIVFLENRAHKKSLRHAQIDY
ncbi:MAG: DMT family transporter [Gammaproteobacteria bacterium]|nr:DMT family transporter [Gammaproteobacteria bacterium]